MVDGMQTAAITLLLTPFVLRELGTGRYGIWILTSSIIGYYGFLDLGFRAGVTQYLTRYLAADQKARPLEVHHPDHCLQQRRMDPLPTSGLLAPRARALRPFTCAMFSTTPFLR